MDTANYFSACDKVMKVLSTQGAFLTVKDRTGKVNVMTIGWALLGIVWRDPILMVAVRPSRYTFGLLENADDFTVTIPFSDMGKELVFCGTYSGSKVDKFKEGGLNTIFAKKVNSPIIDIKNARHYECKIVQMSALDKKRLNGQYDEKLYQDRQYHTYYFGKISDCYET